MDEPTSGNTRYIIQDNNGDFMIEVPQGWHLTFGAVNPGTGNSMGDRALHCLRVWEGTGNNKHLRAVYGNVKGFRDSSIPMARKIDRSVGNASWMQDSEGNFEGAQKVEVDSKYRLEEASPFDFSTNGEKE